MPSSEGSAWLQWSACGAPGVGRVDVVPRVPQAPDAAPRHAHPPLPSHCRGRFRLRGGSGAFRKRAKIACVSGVSWPANAVVAICVVCHDSSPVHTHRLALLQPHAVVLLHDHEGFSVWAGLLHIPVFRIIVVVAGRIGFMAHQFKPVDRDTEMLLPHNMLDWVPEGHAVRVVIAAVERLMTGDLAARLVPPSPKGSAAGPARYDPAMLLTTWMYAYLRGVLSTRAVEDRCRYDATFRVACGRLVPDHTTFSRFRRHLLAQDQLAEALFYRVLYVCACAGLGRLTVVAADGVKIAANASPEANRTEAGLRKLAAQVIATARTAQSGEDAGQPPLPGTDLLLGGDTVPGPDPRSRAGRVLACLAALETERAAAEAAAREQRQAYLDALG